MKLHEHQSKDVLRAYGAPVQEGRIATTPDEVEAAARAIGGAVVVKAQVLVGGRGKAGGVKLAKTPEEARQHGTAILGMDIKGLTVRKVLVTKAVDLAAEYYLGITVNRDARANAVMVSALGGVDIEEVAATSPEKIARADVTPALGLPAFLARRLCYAGGLQRDIVPKAARILQQLYAAYVGSDAMLAEINPLALTPAGELIAVDGKIDVDENALYRRPDLAALREPAEEDPFELRAMEQGLHYVRLPGEVGVIGNGAGLVMATLDAVKAAGAAPACFLDIGGGARAEMVKAALELVLSDPQVKGVMINVFGGITRGDEVARGLLDAAAGMQLRLPIVIRLTGTREEEGRKLLEGSSFTPAATMKDAAQRIVQLVRGTK